MPRINIEDKWWSDPRRTLLGEKLGSAAYATGVFFEAVRVAQQYYRDKKLVPKTIFDCLKDADKLLEVGLAKVTEEGVYLSGAEDHLGWLSARIEAGRKGGVKASESLIRDESGQFKERQKESDTIQANAKQTPSKTKQTQPSYSYSNSSSYSPSHSRSKKQETFANANDTNPDSVQPNLSGKFIAAYVAAYAKRYGQGTRPFLDGKTLGGIKRYLASVAIERACELISAYCQMNDSWFLTKAHDFETFAQNQNKIALALDTGRMTTSQEAKGEERLDYLQQQLIRLQNGLQS
jgi:hypothetical protein